MIAFDLASLSFGTSLLQRLQQLAPELSQRLRKCCLLLCRASQAEILMAPIVASRAFIPRLRCGHRIQLQPDDFTKAAVLLKSWRRHGRTTQASALNDSLQ